MPEKNGSNPPSGNPDSQSLSGDPRADLPKEGIVSANSTKNPDDEENDTEAPSGKVHWINHATFILSIILAVLTAGTLRVYYLQLQQMARQTSAAEGSSYAACVSAQIARQTLLEVQSGEADTHSSSSATVAQAAVTTRGDSALLNFGVVIMNQSQPTPAPAPGTVPTPAPANWANVSFGLVISNIGRSAGTRAHIKYAAQILSQKDSPTLSGHGIQFDAIEAGILGPTFLQGAPIGATLRYLDKGGKPIGPLDPTQLEDLRTGKMWLAVFGRAEYYDIFGLSHWQTFCGPVDAFQVDISAPASKKVRHEECGRDNSVDKNLLYTIPPQAPARMAFAPVNEVNCVEPKAN